MLTLFYRTWGVIHLLAAALSLLLGTFVGVVPKEKTFHKRAGYAYLTGMALMIATAFGIYRQYGGFGVFHLAALSGAAVLIPGAFCFLRGWQRAGAPGPATRKRFPWPATTWKGRLNPL